MPSKNIYRFYIYAYLRSKDSKTAKSGTPYYIGKGQGRRAWSSHGDLNLPRDKSLIVILESNLSEIGALSLERRYIKWYGRKINNTGILHNISEGGESSSGVIPWNKDKKWGDDIKQKISDTKTGVSLGEYYNNGKENILLKNTDSVPYGYIKGKTLSVEQKKQIKKFIKSGKNPESRKKAANTMKKENRPPDFVHGNTGKTKTMWISNIDLKLSKQVKFSTEIPEGWIRGRKFQTPNRKKRELNKKKWIHNPSTGKRKQIDNSSHVPDGWVLGSNLKQTSESNQKRREYSSSRTWITNLETKEEIMISKSDPIPDGWVKGSKKSKDRKDPITGRFFSTSKSI